MSKSILSWMASMALLGFSGPVFQEFESEEMEWNQLRSHESTVGRGEPILYTVTTDDTQFWGANLSLKYQF